VLIQSSGNDSGGVPMTVSLVDTTVDGMGSTNGAAIAANAVGGPLTLTLDGVDLSATGTQPGLVAALGGSFDEEQELTLTVVNSYIHGAATGFSLTGEIYYTATATFENNTFESNGTGVLDSLLDGTGESSTLVFFNNLVVNNMLGISSSDASTFGYNCLYGNTTNYAGSAVSGMGTVESNPLLDTESPPALGPGSPCRAVGDPTHAPSHDFYGRHRSTSIDIGAVQSSP